MPRPLREQVAGGIYHLVSRGVRKLPIFTDNRDRDRFLSLVDRTLQRYRWELHAYCLMTNHFHLLVTTHEPNVSAGMQYLNGRYCQWFDWQHGFEGHVVERRFWSQLMKSDPQLLTVGRYIVLNPVRAGLCRTASAWHWSSHCATAAASLETLPVLSHWLLTLFDDDPQHAREHYAAFIHAGEQDMAQS
ncbi:MAG: transposase [Gaiellaceae bacterium]